MLAARLRAARVHSGCIISVKSQRLARPLMTHWRAIGVPADCRRLTAEAGRGAARPPYGKIKAARWRYGRMVGEDLNFGPLARSASWRHSLDLRDQGSAHLARMERVSGGSWRGVACVPAILLSPIDWHAAAAISGADNAYSRKQTRATGERARSRQFSGQLRCAVGGLGSNRRVGRRDGSSVANEADTTARTLPRRSGHVLRHIGNAV
jgi:hypothetical protein